MFFFSFVLVAFFTISLYHILPLLIFNFSHVFFLFAFPSLFKAYLCLSSSLSVCLCLFLHLPAFFFLHFLIFFLIFLASPSFSTPLSLSLSPFHLSSLSSSSPLYLFLFPTTHVTYLLFSSASNFSHTQCLYPLTSRSLFYALALSFHSLKRLL